MFLYRFETSHRLSVSDVPNWTLNNLTFSAIKACSVHRNSLVPPTETWPSGRRQSIKKCVNDVSILKTSKSL